jgi:hypothetical protein
MANTIIDLDSPDPTAALNAFTWAMANARKLGFTPRTEHSLIEHLIRGDAKVIFYSTIGGDLVSIVESEDAFPDDTSEDEWFELIELMSRQRGRRRRARIEAERAAAACAEAMKEPQAEAEQGAPV